MRVLPRATSLGEFAMGIALRAGTRDWSVLVVEGGRARERTARDLAEEIGAQLGVPTFVTEVTEHLLEALHVSGRPIVVAYEGADVADAVWASLDLDRSRLPQCQSVVLVLTERACDHLERRAPNLASWLGATVSLADAEAGLMTHEEREALLRGLRVKFGMTDAALLALASEGRAPAEPDVATWLVLLGRGDLVAPA